MVVPCTTRRDESKVLVVVPKRAVVEKSDVETVEEAKTFCEKRLRKRSALVPRDEVISIVGVKDPDRDEMVVVASVDVAVTENVPITASLVDGVEVPIPTFPKEEELLSGI